MKTSQSPPGLLAVSARRWRNDWHLASVRGLDSTAGWSEARWTLTWDGRGKFGPNDAIDIIVPTALSWVGVRLQLSAEKGRLSGSVRPYVDTPTGRQDSAQVSATPVPCPAVVPLVFPDQLIDDG